MAGKSGFMILIIIIVVLVLALGGVTAFMLMSGTSKNSTPASTVPNESQLTTLSILDKVNFNLKSADSSSISVIQVSAEVEYYNTVQGISSTATKMTNNTAQISEIIGTYFQGLTISDVQLAQAKETARQTLLKQINAMLVEDETTKSDIVYNIIFSEWFYQ